MNAHGLLGAFNIPIFDSSCHIGVLTGADKDAARVRTQ